MHNKFCHNSLIIMPSEHIPRFLLSDSSQQDLYVVCQASEVNIIHNINVTNSAGGSRTAYLP